MNPNEEQKNMSSFIWHATCSLLIAAIKGKMIGFSRVGSSDVHTTAAAIKDETVTCRFPCQEICNYYVVQKSKALKTIKNVNAQ